MERKELTQRINTWAEENKDYIENFASELLKIDSRNLPPKGNEKQCQLRFAEEMKKIGGDVEVYDVSKVEIIRTDLTQSALFSVRKKDTRLCSPDIWTQYHSETRMTGQTARCREK